MRDHRSGATLSSTLSKNRLLQLHSFSLLLTFGSSSFLNRFSIRIKLWIWHFWCRRSNVIDPRHQGGLQRSREPCCSTYSTGFAATVYIPEDKQTKAMETHFLFRFIQHVSLLNPDNTRHVCFHGHRECPALGAFRHPHIHVADDFGEAWLFL